MAWAGGRGGATGPGLRGRAGPEISVGLVGGLGLVIFFIGPAAGPMSVVTPGPRARQA